MDGTGMVLLGWGNAVSLEEVGEALVSHLSARVVVMVHNEISLRLANPVRDIAEVCRKRDVLLVVDAVSCIRGTDLRVRERGTDTCISASQNRFEVPPGLALVSVSQRAWSHVTRSNVSIQGR